MCPYCQNSDACKKNGSFRSRRGAKIQRFYCRRCLRHYSDKTGTVTYRHRKTHVNGTLLRLLCLGVSQRASAYALAINRKTVARKIERLGVHARKRNLEALCLGKKATQVVFDEMETFEHSKMKPLSIVVAVEKGSRRIFAAEVARMPAKGLLAAKSRKKYGPRKDERPKALRHALRLIRTHSAKNLSLESDQSPRYPKYIKEILPHAEHKAFKGRRGCVVGQGELKAGGFDPLFSLNHSCAMIRDGLKRLTRRTWCTTKCPMRLQYLLDLYIYFHNTRLVDRNKLVSMNP